MLRLSKKESMDFRIIKILEEKSMKIVQVPGKDESMVAFRCDSLQSINGATIVLAIDQERTDAGRGMVRGLWFGKPVIVWISNGLKSLRMVAYPYRCHIVGPVFSMLYRELRKNNSEAEVSAVWELVVDECSETNEPLPDPVQQIPEGEFEYHLDHPSLHVKSAGNLPSLDF